MRAVFFGDVPHRLAGAQRSLLAALSQIGDAGVEPIVVFPSEGAFVDACRAARLDVRVLEAPPAFRTFGGGLTRLGPTAQLGIMLREALPYAYKLARFLERERADVLHFNTARGAIMTGLAAPLSGRSAVLHVRGFVPVGRAYWIAAQAVASYFVLVARFLEDELLPSLRPRSRLVHNGVVAREPLARPLARARVAERFGIAGLDEQTVVFGSLSSPVPYKGLHHLLEAAAALVADGVDARFLLAGTGHGDAYERWLRTRGEELGLGGRVHWLGFVEDTRELLSASDALVLPSVEREELSLPDGTRLRFGCREGLPRSILEAMAAGIPVIATRMGGVSEQVEDGVTGLLVPSSDARALAAAMSRIARDRPFCRAAGERGREIVLARFSVGSAAQGLADVLRAAAAGRPRLERAGDFLRFCREGLSELARSRPADARSERTAVEADNIQEGRSAPGDRTPFSSSVRPTAVAHHGVLRRTPAPMDRR